MQRTRTQWTHSGVELTLPPAPRRRPIAALVAAAVLAVTLVGLGLRRPEPRIVRICATPGALNQESCKAIDDPADSMAVPVFSVFASARSDAHWRGDFDLLLEPSDDRFREALTVSLANTRPSMAEVVELEDFSDLSDADVVADWRALRERGFSYEIREIYEIGRRRLARREHDRLTRIQQARLDPVLLDWAEHGTPGSRWVPWFLIGFGAVLGALCLPLLVGVVRSWRPVEIRFTPSRIEVDGRSLPLEELVEATIDQGCLVIRTERATLRSRPLPYEAIEELDAVLDGVHRPEGREDPVSLRRLQSLLRTTP
ncbi:MAG: hypothetical protein R3F61_37115 [Myxococcota bacterium]